MNDLPTLHDAFDALEHRADATPVHDLVIPPQRRARRFAAPAAAAAAVVVAAATVALWQHDDGSPTTAPAGGGRTVLSAMPSSSEAMTSAPAQVGFQPPTTEAQLTARAREILAGVATIVVTDGSGHSGTTGPNPSFTKGPSNSNAAELSHAPAQPIASAAPGKASGAAIVGTLTADGVTGGFDLDVYASPGGRAMCDADTNCSVHTRPDGSSLAIGTWHDRTAPGGVTYQVEVVRPDGADVLMHLSTEHDPKGESAVTASHLPLSVKQMVEFVTSDRW